MSRKEFSPLRRHFQSPGFFETLKNVDQLLAVVSTSLEQQRSVKNGSEMQSFLIPAAQLQMSEARLEPELQASCWFATNPTAAYLHQVCLAKKELQHACPKRFFTQSDKQMRKKRGQKLGLRGKAEGSQTQIVLVVKSLLFGAPALLCVQILRKNLLLCPCSKEASQERAGSCRSQRRPEPGGGPDRDGSARQPPLLQ